ncbi:hypothetical protein HPB50_021038 [Hyalomma asiaticum]|uniref:Uncharacterized protein n=1 Tax=Hyalomma asiaticum TaxID=266040 RepID=A0ACB7SAE8_HYAAI|nr:hypothetical protein HPB50_021038 [Hyalomma asiaticum]
MGPGQWTRERKCDGPSQLLEIFCLSPVCVDIVGARQAAQAAFALSSTRRSRVVAVYAAAASESKASDCKPVCTDNNGGEEGSQEVGGWVRANKGLAGLPGAIRPARPEGEGKTQYAPPPREEFRKQARTAVNPARVSRAAAETAEIDCDAEHCFDMHGVEQRLAAGLYRTDSFSMVRLMCIADIHQPTCDALFVSLVDVLDSPDASAMNPSSSIWTSIGVDGSIAERTRCGRLAAVAAMALVVKGSDRRDGATQSRSHRHTHTRAPPSTSGAHVPIFPSDALLLLLEYHHSSSVRCCDGGIPSSVRLMMLVSAAARSLDARAMRRLGSSGGSALGSSDPDNRSFGSGTPGLRRASGPVPFFE